MRTTINVADEILAETQALYNNSNRSQAIECALKDAIRFKKIEMLVKLKNEIDFDEETIEKLREEEIDELQNNG